MIFKGTKFALPTYKFFPNHFFFRIKRLRVSCAIHHEEAVNNTSYTYVLLKTTLNIEKNNYFYNLFSDKKLKILKLQLSMWNLVSNCLN